MQWARERLVMIMTLVFVALAVAQTGSTATLAIGVALAAVGVVLGAQIASREIHWREITVGGRARAHKESLAGMASPRHPATPGRPRSRAPGRSFAAA
jgi:disulfide bond formation protein DsbB